MTCAACWRAAVASLYPNAGENAQPEVKAAIKRFNEMSAAEQSEYVLLDWLLGEGTPDYKMPPKPAVYMDKSTVSGQRCDNCILSYQNLVSGRYICSEINPDIKPAGWCKWWNRGGE